MGTIVWMEWTDRFKRSFQWNGLIHRNDRLDEYTNPLKRSFEWNGRIDSNDRFNGVHGSIETIVSLNLQDFHLNDVF